MNLNDNYGEIKQEITKQVIRKFGETWDASCCSDGDTITNSLLASADKLTDDKVHFVKHLLILVFKVLSKPKS